MDKVEYRELIRTIKNKYLQQDYEGVIETANQLDIGKIRENSILEIIAKSYEILGRCDLARDTLLVAYKRTPTGKRIAYNLTMLSIKLDDLDSAVMFYEDFCQMAPKDNQRLLLKYEIGKAGGIAIKDLIKVLEVYNAREMDDKWEYELACLYHEAGDGEKCAAACDQIILWYANGDYEKKALELKNMHKALTPSQQARYEEIMGEILADTTSVTSDRGIGYQEQTETGEEDETEQTVTEPEDDREDEEVIADIAQTVQEVRDEETAAMQEADQEEEPAEEEQEEPEEPLPEIDLETRHLAPEDYLEETEADGDEDTIAGQLSLSAMLEAFQNQAEDRKEQLDKAGQDRAAQIMAEVNDSHDSSVLKEFEEDKDDREPIEQVIEPEVPLLSREDTIAPADDGGTDIGERAAEFAFEKEEEPEEKSTKDPHGVEKSVDATQFIPVDKIVAHLEADEKEDDEVPPAVVRENPVYEEIDPGSAAGKVQVGSAGADPEFNLDELIDMIDPPKAEEGSSAETEEPEEMTDQEEPADIQEVPEAEEATEEKQAEPEPVKEEEFKLDLIFGNNTAPVSRRTKKQAKTPKKAEPLPAEEEPAEAEVPEEMPEAEPEPAEEPAAAVTPPVFSDLEPAEEEEEAAGDEETEEEPEEAVPADDEIEEEEEVEEVEEVEEEEEEEEEEVEEDEEEESDESDEEEADEPGESDEYDESDESDEYDDSDDYDDYDDYDEYDEYDEETGSSWSQASEVTVPKTSKFGKLKLALFGKKKADIEEEPEDELETGSGDLESAGPEEEAYEQDDVFGEEDLDEAQEKPGFTGFLKSLFGKGRKKIEEEEEEEEYPEDEYYDEPEENEIEEEEAEAEAFEEESEEEEEAEDEEPEAEAEEFEEEPEAEEEEEEEPEAEAEAIEEEPEEEAEAEAEEPEELEEEPVEEAAEEEEPEELEEEPEEEAETEEEEPEESEEEPEEEEEEAEEPVAEEEEPAEESAAEEALNLEDFIQDTEEPAPRKKSRRATAFEEDEERFESYLNPEDFIQADEESGSMVLRGNKGKKTKSKAVPELFDEERAQAKRAQQAPEEKSLEQLRLEKEQRKAEKKAQKEALKAEKQARKAEKIRAKVQRMAEEREAREAEALQREQELEREKEVMEAQALKDAQDEQTRKEAQEQDEQVANALKKTREQEEEKERARKEAQEQEELARREAQARKERAIRAKKEQKAKEEQARKEQAAREEQVARREQARKEQAAKEARIRKQQAAKAQKKAPQPELNLDELLAGTAADAAAVQPEPKVSQESLDEMLNGMIRDDQQPVVDRSPKKPQKELKTSPSGEFDLEDFIQPDEKKKESRQMSFDDLFGGDFRPKVHVPAAVQAQTAPKKLALNKKYKLTREQRRALGEFLLIDGMEEEIVDAIENLVTRKKSGDDTGGHMIVTGDARSGKTYLTIEILKAVNQEVGSGNPRVAKVQAQAINGKNIRKVLAKVADSDLIIENIGKLEDDTVRELITAVRENNAPTMVILEGNDLAAENLIRNFPDIGRIFRTKISIGELTLTQWTDIAQRYAQGQGYYIDREALLALHARIDEISTSDMRLGIAEVKKLVDEAIEKSEKQRTGKLFSAFSKKTSDDLLPLTEDNFVI